MHRLTATFLLLFALAGPVVPLALAISAPPPHTCCLRKAHHCRNLAATGSDQLDLHNTDCCNHDCCRALTTSQSATPQSWTMAILANQIACAAAQPPARHPATHVFASLSTRAPPLMSIA